MGARSHTAHTAAAPSCCAFVPSHLAPNSTASGGDNHGAAACRAAPRRRAEERAPVARSQGLGAEPEANEDTQQPDVMASVLEEEHMLALEDEGLE